MYYHSPLKAHYSKCSKLPDQSHAVVLWHLEEECSSGCDPSDERDLEVSDGNVYLGRKGATPQNSIKAPAAPNCMQNAMLVLNKHDGHCALHVELESYNTN